MTEQNYRHYANNIFKHMFVKDFMSVFWCKFRLSFSDAEGPIDN